MKNLVIILGPPASGKMTVGQALKEKTGFKLFHNHLSLELVHQFFEFGTASFRRLDKKIRFDIFHEIAQSDVKGLIFTLVVDFGDKGDEEYLNEIIAIFKKERPKICFVELQCDLQERLIRNKHPNRLKHKPSKRDIDASEKRLLYHDKKYRMNSMEGEWADKKLLKINNTLLSPEEVAVRIVDHFHLADH